MKEQLIQEIQRKMLPYLNNEQLLQLGDALTEALQGVSVSYEDTTPKKEERDAVEAFITAKRIEGCSEKTLKYYRKTIESMLSTIAKKASQITTEATCQVKCNSKLEKISEGEFQLRHLRGR